MNTVIAFIVIFGALVFFHEFGHFLFAKRAGILCREFAIGMGPKIFAYKKGETVYTLRLLPLGGYVRMAGEDPEMAELKPGRRIGIVLNDEEEITKIIVNGKDRYPNARVIEVEKADLEHQLFIKGYEEEEEEARVFPVHREAVMVEDGLETQISPWDRQFASKTLGQRAMTIFAGPLFNFILAFIVFSIVAIIQGIPTDEPELGRLTSDGAAQEAGLQEGDKVISINGQGVASWSDIVAIVQENPQSEVEFTVERNGEVMDMPVTPQVREIEDQRIGVIGVYSPVEKSFFGSIVHGAKETYLWTVEILRLLGQLVTGQFSIDMLSGPVGIYVSTDTVAKSGIMNLMTWAGALSINLGIMNLLPLPALDGGRLLFFFFEAVRGKPLDRQKEGMVHFVGFALLMLLMIVVTWNDIQRFFLQ
ncbi:RIP metalloprotease RseP [Bacillus thermotolerans]|uniref:Zinc metalloprotease n=1 Tax=Bacillus thermotolerans TaxID=1221996 RepID=A0A0F5I078_BACTR|nr:RIP metalloprotease RseP [Bacillus thermotolerans]KKB38943.1 Membrane-associated zinc metalloprotease [Bacillus thermotolerans]KKB42391.1 Membrane-associated zinc metalloprotease [Bacillus thermotolerans]